MAQTLLGSLRLGDDNGPMCVRVSRLWDFNDPKNNSVVLHLNMVLVDEKGSALHAQAYPPPDKKIRSLLAEGKVYYITFYRVKSTNRLYRPVPHDKLIVFSNWTNVEECINVPPHFPSFVFSLTPFEQIAALAEKKEFFLDVIGLITEISPVTSLRPWSQSTDAFKRNIHICDTRGTSLTLTLWGEKAEAFEADKIHADGQSHPQIAIFVGVLPKSYRASVSAAVSLSGGAACKWYINIDVREIADFARSIQDNYQPITWINIPHIAPSQPNATRKQISEITDLNPHQHKKEQFIVTVTVKSINTDNSWWFSSCNACFRASRPYGATYKCNSCGTIGPANARFKLNVVAGDSTGQTQFVLFGRVAQRIIGKSVESLLQSNPPDIDFIPNEIMALLEKTYVWNVSFSEGTIAFGNVCFQVNYIVSVEGNTELLASTSTSSQPPLPAPTETNVPLPMDASPISQASISVVAAPPSTSTENVTEQTRKTSPPGSHVADDIRLMTPPSVQSKEPQAKKRALASPTSGVAKKLFSDSKEKSDRSNK